MTDEAPKSALELAMERLKKQDADAGVVEHKLTDAQKAAIAEARSVHEARVAELQILHRGKQLTAVDPQEIEKIEQEYRRDLERLATDRDSKIRKIRAGDGAEVTRLARPSLAAGVSRPCRRRRAGRPRAGSARKAWSDRRCRRCSRRSPISSARAWPARRPTSRRRSGPATACASSG